MIRSKKYNLGGQKQKGLFEVLCDFCNKHIEFGYWLLSGKDICDKCVAKRQDAAKRIREHEERGLL